MEFYVFSKPGFKQRQSDKLKGANQRGAILIDVDIANDGKIMLLNSQKDHTLLATFIHILGKLDLETEKWEVRKDEFDHWFKTTFDVNNRFNIKKRLDFLKEVGLLQVEYISNTPNKVTTNPKQTSNKLTPKSHLSESLPIRDASNPHGSTRDYNQPIQPRKEIAAVASPPPPQKFSEKHLILANELWDFIHERYPYYKPPKMNVWAETIRKIEELDGFTIEQIEDVAAWALTKSDFWCQQIRGPDNLRKHFRKILDQSGLYAQWEVKKRVTQG